MDLYTLWNKIKEGEMIKCNDGSAVIIKENQTWKKFMEEVELTNEEWKSNKWRRFE